MIIQCHSVTITQDHSVTITQYHSVTIAQYHSVAITQYHSVTITQYHSVPFVSFSASKPIDQFKRNLMLMPRYLETPPQLCAFLAAIFMIKSDIKDY
jgi:hypothetical protein